MRRQLAAALLVSFLVVTLLAGTAAGAGPITFRDTQGNILSVDTATSNFTFSSRFGRVSGHNDSIRPNRRFTITAADGGIKLIASVDMPAQRVNATVVDARTNRWLTSMRNAGTSVPTSPTATPAPDMDAWRAVGDGLLAADGSRSFKLDVFRNPRQPLRGKFEYHDARANFHFVSKRIDRFDVEGTEARVEGVGTLQGRGESKFQVRLGEVGPRGGPLADIKISGFGYFLQDEVRAGRVKVSGTMTDQPTATPTRTPTRMPTYTPTRTPSPIPTRTPWPTPTPTRSITI